MKFNLSKYLVSKSITTPYQYGFRQGVNTFKALTSFSETIYAILNSKNSLSIYTDLQKAIDTVRHDTFFSNYGIRGIIHNWFHDYLTNRTQSTNY